MYNHIIRQDHLFNLDPRIKIGLILMISLVALTRGVTGIEVYIRFLLMFIPPLLLICIKQYTVWLIILCLHFLAWYVDSFVSIVHIQVANFIIFVLSGIVTRMFPSFAIVYTI